MLATSAASSLNSWAARAAADGACVAGLEVHAEVGEQVLDGLKRSDRSSERGSVLGVLEGDVEETIHRSDRLGYGEYQRHLQLTLDIMSASPTVPTIADSGAVT